MGSNEDYVVYSTSHKEEMRIVKSKDSVTAAKRRCVLGYLKVQKFYCNSTSFFSIVFIFFVAIYCHIYLALDTVNIYFCV